MHDKTQFSHELSVSDIDHSLAEHDRLSQKISPERKVAHALGRLTGKSLKPAEAEQLEALGSSRSHNIKRRELIEKEIVKHEQNKRENLEFVRKAVAALDANAQAALDVHLDAYVSPFLEWVKATRSGGPDTDWATWLSEEANDAQLMNFLQWHTAELKAQQQDPEILECIHNEKEEFSQRVMEGVRDNWLVA